MEFIIEFLAPTIGLTVLAVLSLVIITVVLDYFNDLLKTLKSINNKLENGKRN